MESKIENAAADSYIALKKDYAALQAKCDRYEKALKDINRRAEYGRPLDLALGTKSGEMCVAIEIISRTTLEDVQLKSTEALSAGEGEKEPVKEIEYMPILTAELNEKEYKGMANVPVKVPMHLLNEKQAYNNHGQSLARLKERGGISIREALSLINCYHWNYYGGMEARKAVAMLNDLISQKEDQQ